MPKTGSLVDLETTLSMMGQDRSLFKTMAEIYREDFEGLVAGLSESCRSGEYKSIYDNAHKLKGLIANFHVTAVVDRLSHFEQLAKQSISPSMDEVNAIALQARLLSDELNELSNSIESPASA